MPASASKAPSRWCSAASRTDGRTPDAAAATRATTDDPGHLDPLAFAPVPSIGAGLSVGEGTGRSIPPLVTRPL